MNWVDVELLAEHGRVAQSVSHAGGSVQHEDGVCGSVAIEGIVALLSEGDKFLQKGYSYGTFLRVTYEKAHVSMKMLTSVQLSLEVSHLTVHSTSMVE